jgi:hypothetical protein
VRELKAQGFLLALDDFGAGHSNFDRVFTLAPTLVKLDRSVVVKAAQSQTVRRVTTQMVSLLHECGALVLMEGIERREEAVIALDSDTDFVQGYFFGRPAAQLLPPAHTCAEIEETWALCGDRWHDQRREYRDRLQPYVQAMLHACTRMQAGASLAEACAAFLGLPNADVCYLLDASGHQVGTNLFSRGHGPVVAPAVLSACLGRHRRGPGHAPLPHHAEPEHVHHPVRGLRAARAAPDHLRRHGVDAGGRAAGFFGYGVLTEAARTRASGEAMATAAVTTHFGAGLRPIFRVQAPVHPFALETHATSQRPGPAGPDRAHRPASR